MGDYVIHGTIISPDGGEEKSTIIDVKYTDAKISRLFRDDSQMSGFYEIIIVFISFISAFIVIIRFLILFIIKLISNGK